MITIVGVDTISNILAEIKASTYFSVMPEEAANISNKENLPLVIRSVDVARNTREGFVRYHLCEKGTTRETIQRIIINAVPEPGKDATATFNTARESEKDNVVPADAALINFCLDSGPEAIDV